MIKTSAAVAFAVLAVAATAVPASAQDRTPPDAAIRDLTPTIDLRPGQIFMTQHDIARMQEGRSVARESNLPARDSGAPLDR